MIISTIKKNKVCTTFKRKQHKVIDKTKLSFFFNRINECRIYDVIDDYLDSYLNCYLQDHHLYY